MTGKQRHCYIIRTRDKRCLIRLAVDPKGWCRYPLTRTRRRRHLSFKAILGTRLRKPIVVVVVPLPSATAQQLFYKNMQNHQKIPYLSPINGCREWCFWFFTMVAYDG